MTAPSPWRDVTDDDVRAAIQNSQLAKIVAAMESVTSPPLPLAVSLTKAIPLAGCALSQPCDGYDLIDDAQEKTGIELARVRINTAAGQACNVFALVVAPSGTGKDIGGVQSRLASRFGWNVGTSGSAEGLADAFMDNPAGLLSVSEFSPWIDSKHWQSKAASWMTAAFNEGSFKVNLSRRQGGERASRYCYPNIIANVQPETLEACNTKYAMALGFLPRFLIGHVKETPTWRPTTNDIKDKIEAAHVALSQYRLIEGVVEVPSGYLEGLHAELTEHKAPLQSHWGRLVNEYGPRLALMLSASRRIETEHWDRTEVLLRWYYAQAEEVLCGAAEDAWRRRYNRLLARMATCFIWVNTNTLLVSPSLKSEASSASLFCLPTKSTF